MLETDVLKCDDCDEVLYAHLPQRNSEEYPGRIDNIITVCFWFIFFKFFSILCVLAVGSTTY